jgi:hypothetical protein
VGGGGGTKKVCTGFGAGEVLEMCRWAVSRPCWGFPALTVKRKARTVPGYSTGTGQLDHGR